MALIAILEAGINNVCKGPYGPVTGRIAGNTDGCSRARYLATNEQDA
jgi:hypothetical protein